MMEEVSSRRKHVEGSTYFKNLILGEVTNYEVDCQKGVASVDEEDLDSEDNVGIKGKLWKKVPHS